jgi:hypothetical protein
MFLVSLCVAGLLVFVASTNQLKLFCSADLYICDLLVLVFNDKSFKRIEQQSKLSSVYRSGDYIYFNSLLCSLLLDLLINYLLCCLLLCRFTGFSSDGRSPGLGRYIILVRLICSPLYCKY